MPETPQLSSQSQISTQIGLSVSPSNNYLVVAAGAQNIAPYTLYNQSDFDLAVTPQLRSFTPVQHTGQVTLNQNLPLDPSSFELILASSSTESADTKQSLNEPFILPTHSSQNLHLKVSPPLGQKEQEHYLTLIFSAQPLALSNFNSASSQTLPLPPPGSQFNIDIGSNLIILISDNHSDQSQLAFNFKNPPFIADSFAGLKLSFPATNYGQTSTLAQGQIKITPTGQGKVLSTYSFFPDLVLAGHTRDLRLFSPDDPHLSPEIAPLLSSTLPFFQNQFLFGSYTVTAELNSAHHLNENPSTIKTFSVFFFPVYLISALFLTTLILLIALLGQKVNQKRKLACVKKKYPRL